MMDLRMISPCVPYNDMLAGEKALAERPVSLEGRVLGLVPNWRPAAVHLLRAAGELLQQRYGIRDVIMEPPVRISAMARGGKLLDGIRERLENLAQHVDLALTATGD